MHWLWTPKPRQSKSSTRGTDFSALRQIASMSGASTCSWTRSCNSSPGLRRHTAGAAFRRDLFIQGVTCKDNTLRPGIAVNSWCALWARLCFVATSHSITMRSGLSSLPARTSSVPLWMPGTPFMRLTSDPAATFGIAGTGMTHPAKSLQGRPERCCVIPRAKSSGRRERSSGC